jgi:hypothetical protein
LLTTPQRFAESDIRYWQAAVFQRGGTRQASKHFSVQLMAGGRREEFNLGVSNKSVAAHKAREIYEYLKVNGWDATLATVIAASGTGSTTFWRLNTRRKSRHWQKLRAAASKSDKTNDFKIGWWIGVV